MQSPPPRTDVRDLVVFRPDVLAAEGELPAAVLRSDTALVGSRAARDAAYAAQRAAEAARVAAEAARDAALAARKAMELARDAAMEEAAFLREHLQSTKAYLAEVTEGELADARQERAALLSEMALLNEELQRRSREEASPAPGSGAPADVCERLPRLTAG